MPGPKRSRRERTDEWASIKQYWGNGYATEALRAVIAYLFEQTTVNRIYAST
jgi:RimJ/RimL family protein N-acetyltransferase